jgi:hypothetical protein
MSSAFLTRTESNACRATLGLPLLVGSTVPESDDASRGRTVPATPAGMFVAVGLGALPGDAEPSAAPAGVQAETTPSTPATPWPERRLVARRAADLAMVRRILAAERGRR